MSPYELCVGIATHREGMTVAALDHGKLQSLQLSTGQRGMSVLKEFLLRSGKPARLAIAGPLAISLAVAMAQEASVREVFIVSASIADQPVALAHYAEHAL